MSLQTNYLYISDLLSLNDRPIFNKFSYRSTYHFNQWQYYYYSVLIRCQYLSSNLSYRSSEIMLNMEKILSFHLSLNSPIRVSFNSSVVSSDPQINYDSSSILNRSFILFSPLSETFSSVFGYSFMFNHVLNLTSPQLLSRSGRFFLKFFFKSYFLRVLLSRVRSFSTFGSSIHVPNTSMFVYLLCFHLSVYSFLKYFFIRFFFRLYLFYSYKSLFRSLVVSKLHLNRSFMPKLLLSSFLQSLFSKFALLFFTRSDTSLFIRNRFTAFLRVIMLFGRGSSFRSFNLLSKIFYPLFSFRVMKTLLFISQISSLTSFRSGSSLKPRVSLHLLFDHWVFNRFRSFFIKKGLGFQSDLFIQKILSLIKTSYSVDPLFVISNVLYKLLVPMELRQVKIFGKIQSVPNRIRMKRQLFLAFKFLMTNVKSLSDRSNKFVKNIIEGFIDGGDAFISSSRYLKSILENRHLAVSYARRKDKARLRSIKSFHYTPVRSKFYMSKLSKRLRLCSK